MPELSPTVARFARHAKVVMFNLYAVATVVELALVVPMRANFTAIRLDAMNIPPGEVSRLQPNLRDVPYVHHRPPGASRNYQLIRVSTNGEGFRDVDHAIERPPGVFRVAVFGDSFIFGLGLSQP